MASIAAEKTIDTQFYKKEDNRGRLRWYMRGSEMPISGVSMAVRRTNRDTGKRQVRVGIENRVALTPTEQNELGDVQPYLLPDGDLLDRDGQVIPDITVGHIIYNRMNKCEENTLNPQESRKVAQMARERGKRWWSRHFRHAIWREGLKDSDNSIIDALKRLLKEV